MVQTYDLDVQLVVAIVDTQGDWFMQKIRITKPNDFANEAFVDKQRKARCNLRQWQ